MTSYSHKFLKRIFYDTKDFVKGDFLWPSIEIYMFSLSIYIYRGQSGLSLYYVLYLKSLPLDLNLDKSTNGIITRRSHSKCLNFH